MWRLAWTRHPVRVATKKGSFSVYFRLTPAESTFWSASVSRESAASLLRAEHDHSMTSVVIHAAHEYRHQCVPIRM